MTHCIRTLAAAAAVCAASPASAASVARTIDVPASADRVWSTVGDFCDIAKWHPAIASCGLDGKTPPTRILKTKDGATFVERQTRRSDRARLYSYTFLQSPLPVTGYRSTLRVTPRGPDASTLSWNGTYAPDKGHEREAAKALLAIYDSGLTAVRDGFANHQPVDADGRDAVLNVR